MLGTLKMDGNLHFDIERPSALTRYYFQDLKMNQHLRISTRIEIEHSEYSSRTYSSGTSSLRTWLINMTHQYSASRVPGSTMSWWLRLFLDGVPKFNFQMSIYSWKLKIRSCDSDSGFGNQFIFNESIKLIQWNIQKMNNILIFLILMFL